MTNTGLGRGVIAHINLQTLRLLRHQRRPWRLHPTPALPISSSSATLKPSLGKSSARVARARKGFIRSLLKVPTTTGPPKSWAVPVTAPTPPPTLKRSRYGFTCRKPHLLDLNRWPPRWPKTLPLLLTGILTSPEFAPNPTYRDKLAEEARIEFRAATKPKGSEAT